MANKNKLAFATIAIAMATCQTIDSKLIAEIAEQCGVDENTAGCIADEVLAAKDVAEADMGTMFNY